MAIYSNYPMFIHFLSPFIQNGCPSEVQSHISTTSGKFGKGKATSCIPTKVSTLPGNAKRKSSSFKYKLISAVLLHKILTCATLVVLFVISPLNDAPYTAEMIQLWTAAETVKYTCTLFIYKAMILKYVRKDAWDCPAIKIHIVRSEKMYHSRSICFYTFYRV